MALVYLDSAATSLWRPVAVAEAVSRSVMLHAGYGRNQSSSADAAAGEIYSCRCAAAEMFNVGDPADVVFCLNATHALNTAIFGLFVPGRPCVISGYEHNAVVRPLGELERRGATEVFAAESALFDKEDAVRAFERMTAEKKPGLVVCTMVGNVFGNVMPVEEIGRICRKYGARFVVDASQAAGTIPVDVKACLADAVCMPGHKGLMGPTGTGLLLLGKNRPEPFLFGGTGTASEEAGQPETSPERYESGTLNVCGICGLGAALKYVREKGGRLHERKKALCEIFASRLEREGFRIFAPGDGFEAGLFSFDAGFDSETAAGMLASRGIAVRGGLHCAPLAHRSAGTLERGTVRISPNPDIGKRTAVRAAETIAGALSAARG